MLTILSGSVCSYAATLLVKYYNQVVYSDEVTFYAYDYSASTTPSVTYLTVLADSSLGSGSALYHVKYINGTLCYCIQPGTRADDSSNYAQGSGAWSNMPLTLQQAIALAMACGYPNMDYGTAPGDSNISDTIMAEKWAATQAIIWELICSYRSTASYMLWSSSPFYKCVDTSRYPTFALWYDEIVKSMQSSALIPSFAASDTAFALNYVLEFNPATGLYEAQFTDVNHVLPNYDFTHLSGNGITFSQSGNQLKVTASESVAESLMDGKLVSTTGSAFTVNPSRAVISWYDAAGRWQSVANFSSAGRDPLTAYLRFCTDLSSDLTIQKVSAVDGSPLPGAFYRIWDSEGFLMDEGETDEDGLLTFPVLPADTYTYQEITAPSGYLLDPTVYTITLDGLHSQTVKRENAPQAASIDLKKVDPSGAALPGVSFTLQSSSDNGATWSDAATKTTDSSGALTFDQLSTSLRYRIVETSALAGNTLLAAPVFDGTLPLRYDVSSVSGDEFLVSGDTAYLYHVQITVCNSPNLTMPFTGSTSGTCLISLSLLMTFMGIYFLSKQKETLNV